MKAYELGKLYERLSEEDRAYIVQFFLGGLDCVATGFREPHKDQGHAVWAIEQFQNAITNRPSLKAPKADDSQEPEEEIDDSVKCCPDCERPNQFGELCESCRHERSINNDHEQP